MTLAANLRVSLRSADSCLRRATTGSGIRIVVLPDRSSDGRHRARLRLAVESGTPSRNISTAIRQVPAEPDNGQEQQIGDRPVEVVTATGSSLAVETVELSAMGHLDHCYDLGQVERGDGQPGQVNGSATSRT